MAIISPSLTTSRAARRSDVHEDTIRKAARLGELKAYKLAGRSRWRFTPADVDRWASGQPPDPQAIASAGSGA